MGVGAPGDPVACPWRTGRKVGRTIYAQIGDEAADHDLLIGLLDTRELADHAVKAHNAVLRLQQEWGPFVRYRRPEREA